MEPFNILDELESRSESSCFYPARGPAQDSNRNASLRSIYQETLIPVLLPVPLPVLVPIQHLSQSQMVTTKMIEPLDFTPPAS